MRTLLSLSEALVEHIEDLLEALVAKVLDPVEAVVGQSHPERLYAVLLLGGGELGVGQELDVICRGVKLGPGHGLAVHGQHVPLLVQGQQPQRLLLLLGEVHVLQHLLELLHDVLVAHLADGPALLLRLVEVAEAVGLGQLTRGPPASALAAPEAAHHLVELK